MSNTFRVGEMTVHRIIEKEIGNTLALEFLPNLTAELLEDLVRLLPTPGHTIDHFAVQLGRGGKEAVITGDLIHSPLQARYPDLTMRLDYDPQQAVATRRRFLETYCDTDTLCCFSHFPSPSRGYVKRWDDGFRCEYVTT
jgi:glyoxylase-like metal-dependent hydrolase (beta-lactamase superfamily II)